MWKFWNDLCGTKVSSLPNGNLTQDLMLIMTLWKTYMYDNIIFRTNPPQVFKGPINDNLPLLVKRTYLNAHRTFHPI
jgi:hypothetical protein